MNSVTTPHVMTDPCFVYLHLKRSPFNALYWTVCASNISDGRPDFIKLRLPRYGVKSFALANMNNLWQALRFNILYFSFCNLWEVKTSPASSWKSICSRLWRNEIMCQCIICYFLLIHLKSFRCHIPKSFKLSSFPFRKCVYFHCIQQHSVVSSIIWKWNRIHLTVDVKVQTIMNKLRSVGWLSACKIF